MSSSAQVGLGLLTHNDTSGRSSTWKKNAYLLQSIEVSKED